MLIGIFLMETRLHTFISTWFFIQGDLAIIIWGIGIILRGLKKLGIFILVLGLISPIIEFGVDWPSATTAEAFGVIVLDIWMLAMLNIHK